jgi:hypothetical protein
MDPLTMMALVALFTGTGLAISGQHKEAQDRSAAEKYNAQLAEQQAGDVAESGRLEEERLKREKKRLMSRQKSLYAHAGVNPLEGSPLEVMADSAAAMEMDIAANRYNTQAGVNRYVGEANYRRWMAKNVKSQAPLSMGSTLLTAGSGMAGILR